MSFFSPRELAPSGRLRTQGETKSALNMGSDPPRDREDHGDYTVVAVRVRPLDTGHRGGGGECILSVDSARGEISCGREKFCFSSVFSGEEDNAKLFEAVGRPLVGAALLGYNGTLIAYGQTGSGKTYTMEGPEGDRGVTFRTMHDLFEVIAKRAATHEYALKASMVEIYNEALRDLLAVAPAAGAEGAPKDLGKRGGKGLDVKLRPDGSLEVVGLQEVRKTSTRGSEPIRRRNLESWNSLLLWIQTDELCPSC